MTADQLEAKLTVIWQEVMLDPTITSRSSFTDLGGDSLTGVRILSLTRKRLGHQASLTELFQHPTPQLLASMLLAADE